MVLAAGCAKEPIVFDHEKPAFETKEGQILLEVIVPKETKTDDVIYIAGAFNGGDEAAASDVRWQLEHSTTINEKWGIYLDPTTFEDGKTLADGFHFMSTMDGEERTPLNKQAMHYDDPALGTSTNIYVNKWAAFFEVEEVIEHDGYVIYFDDQTGWDEIALYAHGTSEVFGKWPGAQVTGTEKINGKTWKYIDCGAGNAGHVVTLIFFNSKNDSQRFEGQDCLKNVTLNKNHFFTLTADAIETVEMEQQHYLYITKPADWDAIALYAFRNEAPSEFGAWPGAQPTGKTVTVKDMEYFQFAVPAEAIGKENTFIANNNNAGKQAGNLYVELLEAQDYYIVCDGSASTIVDPQNPPATEEPEPELTYGIYISNNLNWDLRVHIWVNVAEGEDAIDTEWPGYKLTEKKTVDGIEYFYVLAEKKFEGKNCGMIVSNNGDDVERYQTEINLDKDLYFNLTSEGLIPVESKATEYRLFVKDELGYENMRIHYWNDGVFTTEWPGAVPEVITENGAEYKAVVLDAKIYDKGIGVIVNNNGDDSTKKEISIPNVNRDFYYRLTADGLVEITE